MRAVADFVRQNQDAIAAGACDLEVKFDITWRQGYVQELARRKHPFPAGGKILSLGRAPAKLNGG